MEADLNWEVVLLFLAIFTPLGISGLQASVYWLADRAPTEKALVRSTLLGLGISMIANMGLFFFTQRWGGRGDLDLGSWLQAGSYEIPLVFRVDPLGSAFAGLSIALTFLVTGFSKTYLHREPGFLRFFFLMGGFTTGAQLVAYAGALDLLFAGWELMGISSALYIGFFHERLEPIRSSVRAFATYRLCDAGFLLGIVSVHEWLGSTRLSDVSEQGASLTLAQATTVSALFLLTAAGKSAQIPFSGWLSRAMEGPTPSSALFYGGISIHAGLFLLLRVWPIIDWSPGVEAAGVGLGLLTAAYASAVARVHPDAKGILAHATLAQVGLIFAEISAGFTQLALFHLLGHGFLRVWQYLRAPNALHDSHRMGASSGAAHGSLRSGTVWDLKFYSLLLHHLRMDEFLDAVVRPFLKMAAIFSGKGERQDHAE